MKSKPLIRFAALLLLALCAPLGAQQQQQRAFDCAACHRQQAKLFGETGMARSLSNAAHGRILQSHKRLTFAQGDYKYSIDRDGQQSIYRVWKERDGLKLEEFTAAISWAFGVGAAGQTYLIERDGKWYEARVSYYHDTDALDLTVGARPDPPRSLSEALGRELSIKGASECFNCHTTGAMTAGELRPEKLTPGIQCQRCHTNADAHQAGFASAKAEKVVPAKLGALAAEEMSDFCGQCHRTWQQIAADGPHNITNVRFQPYRMTNSKCYDASETRLKCTTCHDVHDETVKPASFYDEKCGACHAPGQKAANRICKTGKQDCTSCHMPKVRINSAHNAFTDHWIRIDRPGEAPPY